MRASMVLAERLKAQGTRIVFGYPGVSNCPIFHSLQGAGLQTLLVRHETNAGHMANGYARMTRQPGVVTATSGPGAVNLLPALATASVDSVPLVAITGQVESGLIGHDAFQEADIRGASEPFVKYSYLVKAAADIPYILKEAFYIAGTGRPGPVLMDIPVDILYAEMEYREPGEIRLPGYVPVPVPDVSEVEQAAQAIREARRPLMIVGGGAVIAGAETQVKAFSEQAGVPVVATLMGIGVMPTLHEHYFGMLGIHGRPYANYALREADLIVVAGGRVGNRALAAPVEKQARIVHIDIDPAEIGKNISTDISVCGDLKQVLSCFLQRDIAPQTGPWLQELQKQKKQHIPDFTQRAEGVNPKAFSRRLSELMPDDAVCVADVGQNQLWFANNLLMRGGRFLTSGGMGTMGYAIPAGLGAKLADPAKRVVAMCGDGAFQMSFMELATAVRENIAIGIVVMNNGALGMVREHQKEQFDGVCTATDLGNIPDIIQLARAYGIPAVRVHTHREGEEAIREMLKEDRLFLIECVVSPDEGTM